MAAVLRCAVSALLLISALAASASQFEVFWRGALAAAEIAEPAINITADGYITFAGPGGVTCRVLRTAAVETCSMAVLHLQEACINREGASYREGESSLPTAQSPAPDAFLHLYLPWTPVHTDSIFTGLPDLTQSPFYRSVQCTSRAVDAARIVGKTVSRRIGIIAEGPGCFAALAMGALRSDDVGWMILHQPVTVPQVALEGKLPLPQSLALQLRRAVNTIAYPESRVRASLDLFDACCFAQAVRCPVLLIYTETDPQMPLEELSRLYGALRCPKQSVLLDQYGHVPYAAVPDRQAIFAQFASKVLAGEAQRKLAGL